VKLIATIPLRNESWILGLSVRAALLWCDEVIALNHASTDQTADMLGELQAEFPSRLHVLSVPEKQWNEMQHRQMMLDLARAKGATHGAIVDADEILTGNLLDRVRDAIEPLAAGELLHLPGYYLRCGTERYHLNGVWGRRWFSSAFRMDDRLYWAATGRDNYEHHHREPMGTRWNIVKPITQDEGGVLHLWGANERRLKAKHALYKVTERLRWTEKPVEQIDQMYSWWKNGCDARSEPASWLFRDVPKAWWAPYEGWMQHVHLYREPWQENEVKTLVEKHGREKFAGLDLFGVA